VLYGWRRSDGSALVFGWSMEGDSIAVNLPEAIIATDVFGQRIRPILLSEEAILFRSQGNVSAEMLLNSVARALER
jgi:hypothetical protein